MAETKHTPGPWGLDGNPHQLPNIYAGHDLVPDDQPLAPYIRIAEILWDSGVPLGTAQANAQLIIAAPDFMSACGLDGDPDISRLDWLSALLSGLDEDLASGRWNPEDSDAHITCGVQCRELLDGLRAAAAKARGEAVQ